jgi:hypothetical protein
MQTDLGFGPAFAELVAAKCRRSWVGTALFETEVPVAHRAHLFRAKMWDNSERKKYDKMIDNQKSATGKAQRRENPNRVACPHRLTFAWSNDEEVPVEAQHLVMVLAGETLSDFAGEDGRVFGGLRARAEYELMVKELREAWANQAQIPGQVVAKFILSEDERTPQVGGGGGMQAGVPVQSCRPLRRM